MLEEVSADPFEHCRSLAQQAVRHCRVPTLAEAGWDVWERLAALEPADANKGTNGAGHLETGLKDMTAVLEQRNRLQVSSTASLPPWQAGTASTLPR